MPLLKSSAVTILCCLPLLAQAESPGLGFKLFNDTSVSSCLDYGQTLLNSFQLANVNVRSSYVSVRAGDVNIMIACGGTTNTLIVAGDTIGGTAASASCVYNALLPYIETRSINNSTPMNCNLIASSSDAQIDDALNIHIPRAAMPSLGADTNLWVDLKFIPNDQGLYIWELGNAGVNE